MKSLRILSSILLALSASALNAEASSTHTAASIAQKPFDVILIEATPVK